MFETSVNTVLATLSSSFFIVGAPWLMAMSKTILATILFALLLLVHPTNADKENEPQPISQTSRKHFVLVHGSNHGAWQWYKLIPPLQKAGHNVTAVDLGAAGRRPENLTDLNGFPDYVKPLVQVMNGLPAGEKVIIVAHSYGGIPFAWVAERYPEKILVGVLLAAYMPDTTKNAYTPVQRYLSRLPPGYFVDTQINSNFPVPRLNPTLLFGPIDLRTKAYNRTSDQDYALALTLIRITSTFQRDLSSTTFTAAKYGSVPRVYIVSTQDFSILTSYQREMIKNFPPREVREINADHMQMLSAPFKLLGHLFDIANRYGS